MWIQILKIPFRLLFPLITIFCFIGVYSVNNNFYELVIMIVFGVLFYILKKIEYEPGPFILAMILGPMMETNFRQSLTISRGDPAIFLQRPVSAFFLFVILAILVGSVIVKGRQKEKKANP
jgi:putative tricarboxylic transport membrane protein